MDYDQYRTGLAGAPPTVAVVAAGGCNQSVVDYRSLNGHSHHHNTAPAGFVVAVVGSSIHDPVASDNPHLYFHYHHNTVAGDLVGRLMARWHEDTGPVG